jgi:hypothetical protein
VCLLSFGTESSNVDVTTLDIPVSTLRLSWLHLTLQSLAVSPNVLLSSPSGATAVAYLVFTDKFYDVLKW